MALPGIEQDTSKFSLSCEQWADYPANLVYPSEFEHELASYRATLTDSRLKLFHPNPRMRLLHIWSLEIESQDHILTPNLKTKAEIQQILASGTSCPVERYIFAQSVSSRDALACEKEQMLLILSHIQVMPSFLDIMFTFRAREDPHMRTRLFYETCLGKSQPRLTLPFLGISGFRVQHCFNLIGVEKDETQDDPWLIRQTAAYHSFDVACRRSTWIVLKGNKLIRDRLQASTAGYRKRHPEYPQTVQGCFFANLRSHMLIFQWSAENWESYIDYLEAMLRRPRNVATYGPVLELAKDEGIEMRLKKNETWASLKSRQGTGLSDMMSASSSPTKSGRVFGIFRSSSGLDSQLNQPSPPVSPSLTGTDGKIQDLDLDELFSFDQLQSLHGLGTRIQEAINILAQNKRLLEEVKQYFKCLIESQNFLSFVDLKAYTEDVAIFFRGVNKIIREMDNHQARLQDMLHDLEKNTTLFNDILQYRNMRLGEFFSKQGQMLAMQAKISTDSMHVMSIKSRREAVSMHVITIWTLIFLPGTFVATFFSSGILKFDEVHKFGEWGTSWVGLGLFFLIACPIMLMTLAGWGYFYYHARGDKLSENDGGFTNIEKALEAGIGVRSQ